MLTVRHDGPVAVVALDHGPVNALDTALCDAITTTFEDLARRDDDVGAVVLTGNGRAFSAGVDLPHVLDGSPEDRRRFLASLVGCFVAVFRIATPTVAAVDGHAIAGGCVIACACDHRVAASAELRIGLTELAVGVPFPTSALEIVRSRTGHHLHELVLGARTYGPREALERGLVDEVVPPEQLESRALEVARRLAAVPPATYRLAKLALQHPAADRIDRLTGAWDPQVIELWSADPVVGSAMERFAAEVLGGR